MFGQGPVDRKMIKEDIHEYVFRKQPGATQGGTFGPVLRRFVDGGRIDGSEPN